MDIVITEVFRDPVRWQGTFRRADATFPVGAIHVTAPGASGWRFSVGAPSNSRGRQSVVYPGDVGIERLYPSLDDALHAAKQAVRAAKVVDKEVLHAGEYRAFQWLLNLGRIRCETCGRRLKPNDGMGYAGAFVEPYAGELRDETSWPPVQCASCQERAKVRAIQTDYEAHLQPPLEELLRQWKQGEEQEPT